MTTKERAELQGILNDLDYFRAEYAALSNRHADYFKRIIAAMPFGTHVNIPDPSSYSASLERRVNAITTGCNSSYRLSDMQKTGITVLLCNRDETTVVNLCDIRAGWLDENEDTCTWNIEFDGDFTDWKTECGHTLANSVYNPTELDFVYCPMCSRTLKLGRVK